MLGELRLPLRNLIWRLLHAHEERTNYPRFVAAGSPNVETIEFVRASCSKIIAEIGIYNGATSLELAKVLDGSGELHLFDYYDRVAAAKEKIEDAGFCNVKTYGSSY